MTIPTGQSTNQANPTAPAHRLPVSRTAAAPMSTPAASQNPVAKSREAHGTSSPVAADTAATSPGRTGGLVTFWVPAASSQAARSGVRARGSAASQTGRAARADSYCRVG